MNSLRLKTALLFICILALLFANSASAIKLPPTGRLVSPDTVLLIDIENFSQLKSQFESTSYNKLYKDPSMQPFFAQIKEKIQESVKEMDENNLLRALYDAEIMPKQRLSLAVSYKGQEGEEPSVLLISQWGQETDKIKDTITKAMEKNIELGGRRIPNEDFQGVTIEGGVDEIDTSFYYCFIDDCFIESFSLEQLKYTIAHIRGASSESLADDTDYTNAMSAVGRSNDMTVYVNIKHLIKTALANDTQGMAQMMMASLGFNNITALAASLDLAPEPTKPAILKALLKINGSKKGLLSTLEPQTKPMNMPRFISPQNNQISIMNIDVKKVYNELAGMIMMFNPMVAKVLYYEHQNPEGGPPVRIKENVMEYMGSEVIISQNLNKPFSKTKPPMEYIVAIATSNRTALEKSLSILHGSTIGRNNPDSKRELLGHTLYIISAQGLSMMGGPGANPMENAETKMQSPAPLTMAFTLTDTHLIFGLESSVENAIRTIQSGESLQNTRWFNQAKSAIPSATGALDLKDIRASMELVWWMFKQQKDGAKTAVTPETMILKEVDLDFSLLPEYDKVSKYFGLAASYLNSTEDGYYMEMVALDQPPK